MKPPIKRLIELQRLLMKFSHVERVIHRQRPDRDAPIRENDTEHSYNLALTAWYLADNFDDLDSNIVIRFALVHDLVEVHAGDTYAYADKATLNSKEEREAKALVKLKEEWSDFPEMIKDIEAYESRETNEAKFVYALDKIMPIMTIYINNGYTWKQEGITLGQLEAIKVNKVAVSEKIVPYYEELIEILRKSPELIPASKSNQSQ